MANGDTKTESYLRVAAEGTRADLPTDTCCNTKTQNLILGVANRIMDVEDEVERLENNPDVADIVATYSDLENYDKTQLTDKDVIRVLQDSTHDDESTYYRYDAATGEFTYIGTSKQYTNFVGTDGVVAGQSGLVPAPAATDADKFLKSDGTWAEASGGSSVTVVQTAGISQTDVMSQNAVTSMVFADPSTRTRVQIGSGSSVGSNRNVAIGQNATASNTNTLAVGSYAWTNAATATAVGDGTIAGGVGGTAIGYLASAGTNAYSVALGERSSTSRNGEVNVGTGQQAHGFNSTKYRVIGGVHDGQDAHDAATVGQINAMIDNINTALSTNIPHIGAQS